MPARCRLSIGLALRLIKLLKAKMDNYRQEASRTQDDSRARAASRAKEFRKPFKIRIANPGPPTLQECHESINIGLSDNVKVKELKNHVNLVNNLVQRSNALDPVAKEELAENFKAVHDRWQFFQYERFFRSPESSPRFPTFQSAAQDFLKRARTLLFSQEQSSNEPLMASASKTTVPNELIESASFILKELETTMDKILARIRRARKDFPTTEQPNAEHQAIIRELDKKYKNIQGVTEMYYDPKSYQEMADEKLMEASSRAEENLKPWQRLLGELSLVETILNDLQQWKTHVRNWDSKDSGQLMQDIYKLQKLKQGQNAMIKTEELIRGEITKYANIRKNVEIEQIIRQSFMDENDRKNARNWRTLEFYREAATTALGEAESVRSTLLEINDTASVAGLGEKLSTVHNKCEAAIQYLEKYLSQNRKTRQNSNILDNNIDS